MQPAPNRLPNVIDEKEMAPEAPTPHEPMALEETRSALLVERQKLAHLTQTDVREVGCYYDPIEDDPKLAPLIKRAERKAEKQTRDFKVAMGLCYIVWGAQQRILKEEHGIDWFSPDEMNPNITFD